MGYIGLFGLAAVTAHWLLRAATAGDPSPEDDGGVGGPAGLPIQVAAVAVPVGTMAVAAHLLPRVVSWPLAGAVTVVGYLGVMGIGSALGPRADVT